MNVKATEVISLLGAIDPDANAVGAVSTGWVSAADFERYMAVVFAGTLGIAATVDAKLEQATDATGTGVADVTGKAITQLVKASNDDNQAIINLNPRELTEGFTHFRLTVTVGTATSDAGGAVFGFMPTYAPGSQAASVVEVV
jgi:hypothetical protein